MIDTARRSKVLWTLIAVLIVWGAKGACALEGGGSALPEAPGVYVKMKSGELIELKPESPFQYKMTAGAKGEPGVKDAGVQSAKRYFLGKPGPLVNMPYIEGFFVFGDYKPSSFSITRYKPAVRSDVANVVEGSDTGKGVGRTGTFVDSESGWSAGEDFKWVEKEPKLYWITVKGNLPFPGMSAGFLAVTFGEGQYYPFVDFNDYERFKARVESIFGPLFGPPLNFVFHPVNKVLNRIPMIWAMICALSLFIGTMLWVNLILKKDYVNKGRPFVAWYTDLRLWTIISMLPHVLVYFYFNN